MLVVTFSGRLRYFLMQTRLPNLFQAFSSKFNGISEGRIVFLFLSFCAVFYLASYVNFIGLPNIRTIPWYFIEAWDQSNYYSSAKALARLEFLPQKHYYPIGYPLFASILFWLLDYNAFVVVNISSFLLICFFLLKIYREFMTIWEAILLLTFSFLFQYNLFQHLLMPWTNILVFAFFSVAVAFYKSDNLVSQHKLLGLGLIIGAVFMCRPTDAFVLLFPIYLAVSLQLIVINRSFRGFLTLTMATAILPILVLVFNLAVYGNILSDYVREASRSALNFSNFGQKAFSFFFGGEIAYATKDPMLFKQFPWLVFYLGGVALFFYYRRWKDIIVQACVLSSLGFTVAFAALHPANLMPFGGLRFFMLPIVFMTVPSYLFVRDLVLNFQLWKCAVGFASLLTVVTAFTGVVGLRQVPVAEPSHSYSIGSAAFADRHLSMRTFEFRSPDGKDFRFGQIYLPGFTGNYHQVYSSSDYFYVNKPSNWETTQMESDQRCWDTRIIDLFMVKDWGIFLPLFMGEVSSSNLRVSVPLRYEDTGVSGNVWLFRTEFCLFCGTGNEVEAKARVARKGDILEKTVLYFNSQSSRLYLGAGWSKPEPEFTWTEGKRAEVFLPPAEGRSDVLMTMEIMPLMAGEAVPRQRVQVSVNGYRISSLTLTKSEMQGVQILIPRAILRPDGDNHLEFELPDAQLLKTAGSRYDERRRALAFRRLSFKVIGQDDIRESGTSHTNEILEETFIRFNSDRSRAFLGTGWSKPEPEFTWTEGKRAELILPLAKGDGDLSMTLQLSPFTVGSAVPEQRLNISINGRSVAKVNLKHGGFQQLSLRLPRAALNRNRKNNLVFELPDARSPKELGLSADGRVLALAIHTLRVSPVDSFQTEEGEFHRKRNSQSFGKTDLIEKTLIRFIEPQSHQFLGNGWSDTEAEFTWTLGHRATALLPPTAAEADVYMTMDVSPFIVGNTVPKQRVKLLVNGELVSILAFREAGLYRAYIRIPRRLLRDDLSNELVFDLPDARSPKEIGLSADDRVLALAFKSLRFAEGGLEENKKAITYDFSGGATYRREYLLNISKQAQREAVPDSYLEKTSINLSDPQSRMFLGEGWSITEPAFTWTDDRRAELFLPPTQSESDVLMTMEVRPFVFGHTLPQQRVLVFLNGQIISTLRLREDAFQDITIRLPRALLETYRPWKEAVKRSVWMPSAYWSNDIVFELPEAKSPEEAQLNSDKRQLALAVKSIKFTEDNKKTIARGMASGPTNVLQNTFVRFDKGQPSEFLVSGWEPLAAANYRTIGQRAELALPPAQFDSDLLMTMEVAPFPEQSMNILVNGKLIATRSFVKIVSTRDFFKKNFHRSTIRIPRTALKGDRSNNIVFELPEVELKKGPETPEKTVVFKNIWFTEANPKNNTEPQMKDLGPLAHGRGSYLVSGWLDTGDGVTWSAGSEAVLKLPKVHNQSDLETTLILTTGDMPTKAISRVQVSVNGMEVAVLSMPCQRLSTKQFLVPGEALSSQGQNIMTVRMLRPESARNRKNGGDQFGPPPTLHKIIFRPIGGRSTR